MFKNKIIVLLIFLNVLSSINGGLMKITEDGQELVENDREESCSQKEIVSVTWV